MKTCISFLAAASLSGSLHGAEIRFADCPEPVRKTIQENRRDGKIDEIESFAIQGKTLYVAEVELPGDRDLKIHVAADGTLIKTREDTGIDQVPEAVRKTVDSKLGGGVADDVDMETAGKAVTYHVEIDRKGSPDLDLVIDEDGKLLSESEDMND